MMFLWSEQTRTQTVYISFVALQISVQKGSQNTKPYKNNSKSIYTSNIIQLWNLLGFVWRGFHTYIMQYTFENNLIKAIFPTCFMRLRGEGCLLTNAIPTATKDSEATGKHLPPEEFQGLGCCLIHLFFWVQEWIYNLLRCWNNGPSDDFHQKQVGK